MKNTPRISPTFSRISRSAPPLMTLSKILTDIFRTANNLTHCKTTNQLCAGDASIALASAILSCDRYSIFEQDYPRSGLIRQAVRHTGHSVQRQQFTATGCADSSKSAGKSEWRQLLQCNYLLAQSGIDAAPRSHNCW
ncbi:hypothetical protein ECMP02155211_4847 [Escherichia coli MP021552.11]|nr:hypothetical protein ECMP02155211_4847 [Escherichia coli MP021552.11]